MAFDLVGTDLEHYRLLSPLGAGSMSEVYRAQDLRLDKEVAVKVIREHALIDPARVRRFAREAKAAARLQHPNVATVYFYGTHGSRPFFAMEWVRGPSLAAIIEGKMAFRWSQYLGLFAQAAAGLQAAADRGVLHRDVKPANLLVNLAGRLKVVDFGLAKLGDDGPLSRSQLLAGTPYYVPPEIVARSEGDSRSDLYSLGSTFFHFASGRRPFDADTPYDVMMKHLGEPAPFLSDLGPQFPAPLASLLAQMMAKRKEDRPPSFREVLLRLERLRGELASSEDHKTALAFCHKEEINTPVQGEACPNCGSARTAWEGPQWFDVDVVAWSRNDGEARVAAYLAQALGQEEETVLEVLRPLPFRAAFQQPRDRARSLQKRLYELGADVSLSAAETQPDEPRHEDRNLPFDPPWPSSTQPAQGTPPLASSPRDDRRTSRALSNWLGLSLFLALVSILALVLERSSLEREVVTLSHRVLELQEKTSKPTPPPQDPAANGGDAGVPQDNAAAPTVPIGEPAASQPDLIGAVLTESLLESNDTNASPSGLVVVQTASDSSEKKDLPPTPGFDLSLASSLGMEERLVGVAVLNQTSERLAETVGWPRSLRLPAALLSEAVGDPRAANLATRAWRERPTDARIEVGLPPGAASMRDALFSAAVHQTTRAILQRRLSSALPGWLDLGLACHLEGRSNPDAAARAIEDGQLPTEVSVKKGTNPEDIEAITSAFVGHIVDKVGWQRLRNFLGGLGKGTSPEVAAETAFGQSLKSFEAQWVAEIGAGL